MRARFTQTNYSKKKIKTYLNVFDSCYVFRELNPLKKSFARYQSRPYTATRMNFFLTSKGLRQQYNQPTPAKVFKSDHKIALLTIKVGLEERGKGY